MNPLLDAALAYVQRGWSVIPINPKSKVPLIKWKEYGRRLPEETEIRGWWREFPQADVAIVTGRVSGLVVVDIDPDKGGTDEALRGYTEGTYQAATRGGGRHLYYSAPSGDAPVRNSAGRIANGVDVRGEMGYVLAPPTSGYVWTVGPESRAQPVVFKLRVRDPTTNGSVGQSEHWIERLLEGVGRGERNAAAARLAGYFIGKGSPVDVVTKQLLAWNGLNDPPLPAAEIRTVVESVSRTEADRRDRERRHAAVGHDSGRADGGTGFSPLAFAAYVSKYAVQRARWMVDRWLPAETVAMVVAPPGSYKTWLLQDLAVSVASGLPFLGQFPVRQGKVLFMQQEDWHGQIAHRFSLIAARRAGLVQPRIEGDNLIFRAPPAIPIFVDEERLFRFDDEKIVGEWSAWMERVRPSLVILDPLYSAGSVDDFMAGTARSMFLFKHMRDRLGTTFVIAHHTRKSTKDGPRNAGPEREDVWGSQFLNAWIETGWQVRKREELGSATILRHFKVQSEAAKAIVSFNIDTTQMPTKYDVAVREAKEGDDKEEEKPDIVRVLEIKGPVNVAGLVRATGLPRATVYRRLDNLTRAGIVAKDGDKYVLTESLDAEER